MKNLFILLLFIFPKILFSNSDLEKELIHQNFDDYYFYCESETYLTLVDVSVGMEYDTYVLTWVAHGGCVFCYEIGTNDILITSSCWGDRNL